MKCPNIEHFVNIQFRELEAHLRNPQKLPDANISDIKVIREGERESLSSKRQVK